MNKWYTTSAAVVSLTFLGCGGGETRTPTHSVTGKVTDGSGKPVAGAQVIFHPAGVTANTPKPHGDTAANGEFKLTTYDGNDGAPAGQYKVTVQKWATPNMSGGPVNQLLPKYADPDQSGFTATVTVGPNELQPFVIKK